MKVFKFGGASVKGAKSIINLANILKSEGYHDTFLVISAMGKMTNAFEEIILSYHTNSNDLADKIAFAKRYHANISKELFQSSHPVFDKIEALFYEINNFFLQNKNNNYDYIYDQIVGYAELISTLIISNYLNVINIQNTWLDARELIKTNRHFRNAAVDWHVTCQNITKSVRSNSLYITQGFIGAATKSIATTLGREGSDYSAAIVAYCLNAESLTIWKDVPGVLNADPRYFKHTQLLEQISYREVLEMAFYGASVIHPKTIKPLENKNIPLYVRSFTDVKGKGTLINKETPIFPLTACYTHKSDQILLSIAAKDFSFMIEHNISHIFKLFTEYKINVNLIQNSAISFSVCIEDPYNEFENLSKELTKHYEITFHRDVTLISIRHFSKDTIQKTLSNKNILLQQQSDETVQFVVKNNQSHFFTT